MFRYLGLAVKNTWRNKRRTILTVSSMTVSLCLLGVLIAIYHAMFYGEPSPGQALRVMVRHKVSLGNPLPESYEGKIRQVPGVKELTPYNWFGGSYKDARDTSNFFARFGVDPAAILKVRTQLDMPEDQKRAFISDRTACIVSRDLADKLGLHLGERITLTGDIYPVNPEFVIRGIFDDPDAQNSLFFNMEYIRQLVGPSSRGFDSMVAILANSPEDVPKIASAVDDMFAASQYPTKTESEQQFTLSFVSFLGNVKLFLMAICAAVTFTILLVSGNTVAMSVRERIREVGVLKTLGFTNDAILGMIIGEATTVALIGGALGVVLAALLSAGIGHIHQSFVAQLHFMSLTPGSALLCLAIAALIGIVSSFVPAWNAARTNILDSLRYAG
ncbi:MAG TPA: FtsX-like permease family protein [Bryobacteraceae bacterium]|jgi:putative ABC transport system permease protein|nr:FtsX-like permease family protein [Bryobacteraceae bacterium]